MSEEKKAGGSIRLHLKRGKDFSLDVEFELNQSGITVLSGPQAAERPRFSDRLRGSSMRRAESSLGTKSGRTMKRRFSFRPGSDRLAMCFRERASSLT